MIIRENEVGAQGGRGSGELERVRTRILVGGTRGAESYTRKKTSPLSGEYTIKF